MKRLHLSPCHLVKPTIRATRANSQTCYGVERRRRMPHYMSPAIKPQPKLSTSELLPGVEVSLNVKPPQVAFTVVVSSPEGQEPEELYAGLRAVGFKLRPQTSPPTDGVRRDFGRDGSAM